MSSAELTADEIAADLAAEDEQRRSDRKLLAEVLRWSRTSGYGKAREYECGRFAGYSWKAPYWKLHFDPYDPTLYYGGSAVQPETVREAVDVLAALGVIPQTFSSAYRAGVESLPWHYAVQLRHGDVKDFGEDLVVALNFAAPVDDYPALTVLRWRQGIQETAVIPDVNARDLRRAGIWRGEDQ